MLSSVAYHDHFKSSPANCHSLHSPEQKNGPPTSQKTQKPSSHLTEVTEAIRELLCRHQRPTCMHCGRQPLRMVPVESHFLVFTCLWNPFPLNMAWAKGLPYDEQTPAKVTGHHF